MIFSAPLKEEVAGAPTLGEEPDQRPETLRHLQKRPSFSPFFLFVPSLSWQTLVVFPKDGADVFDKRRFASFPTSAPMGNVIFFEFSLCLSRACLGKMIVFIYKWRKTVTHSCVASSGWRVPAPFNISVKTAEISATRVS